MPTPVEPLIHVFFGTIATGKSTLARAWAEMRGLSYYNSDVVRKELAGLAVTSRQPEAADQGIYTAEFSRRTYDELLRRAAADLERGRGVVLDASYLEQAERDRVNALAARFGLNAYFILCECSDQVRRQRLAIRARDPQAVSDGRWEIYLRQQEKFEPATELAPGRLIVIDTAPPLAQLLDQLTAAFA